MNLRFDKKRLTIVSLFSYLFVRIVFLAAVGARFACLYSFVQDLPQRKVVAVWRREVALTNTQKDLVETIKNYYNR